MSHLDKVVALYLLPLLHSTGHGHCVQTPTNLPVRILDEIYMSIIYI